LVKKYEHWLSPGRNDPDSSTIDLLNEYMMPLRQKSTVTWRDNRNSEITRHKVVYDKNGYAVRVKYLSVFGTTKSDPLGNYGMFYQLCENGQPAVEWVLGPHGDKAEGNGGHPVVKTKYNEMGNIIEQSYWSSVDTAVIHPIKNYHRVVKTYDERGDISTKSVFGCHGEPVLDEFGVHRSIFSRDPGGWWESDFYYGINGELVLGFRGFAGGVNKVDSLGRVVEKWYYGSDSTVMTLAIGFASIKTVYFNGNTQVIEDKYFDKDNKPVPGLFGVYRYSSRWDISGRCVEQWYGDSLGNPMRSKYGYARTGSLLSERGQVIEFTYYDIDGKMIKLDHGYARDRDKYDEKGNMVEETYYDEQDKPTIMNKGYFMVVFKYDEWGNITEESYFGLHGEIVNNTDGYARVAVAYDGNGDIQQAVYYDKNGKAVKPRAEKKINRNVTFL
jgi:hypothetical protein